MWMHWLGEKNQADGFPPSEYVSIGHALVWIAREMSGTRWSTTTGSAWIRFFMWLQPLLQAGARRPPAPQPRATFQEHAVPQQRPSFHAHPVPQQAAPQEQAAPLEEHLPETVPQQAAPVHEAASPAADTDVSSSADPSAGEDEPKPAHDQAVPDTSAPPRATSSTRRQARQR